MRIDMSKVNLTEKDIEDFLCANPEYIRFTDDTENSYRVTKWVYRQYKLPSGIADIFGIVNDEWPVVVEVKNVPIDAKAITQVCRYAKDIRQIFWRRAPYIPHDTIFKIVVGTGIDGQTLHECEGADVIPLVFSAFIDLRLSRSNWTEEYLSELSTQYDDLSQCKELDVFEAIYKVFGTNEKQDERPENEDKSVQSIELES